LTHQNHFSLLIIFFLTGCAIQTKYPPHWWPSGLPNNNELILTDANELGVLLNHSSSPFWFNKKRYESIEGFWQMMKFPDPDLNRDPRTKKIFPFTREEVAKMSERKAQEAGKQADLLLKELNVNGVSFEGKKMVSCSNIQSDLYYLLKKAMVKKYRYNQDVRRILKATGNLTLTTEKDLQECQGPEWKTGQLWMKIRKENDWRPFMSPW
jgi:predicted NAD-dependent protein-ADP-ribosyltransferase YbiA (DUF1768 family)